MDVIQLVLCDQSNVFTAWCAFVLLMSNCSQYSVPNYPVPEHWGEALIGHIWVCLSHALHEIRAEWELNTDASRDFIHVEVFGHMHTVWYQQQYYKASHKYFLQSSVLLAVLHKNETPSTGKNIVFLNVLQEYFNWLWNNIISVLMPLCDLHKQTEPAA